MTAQLYSTYNNLANSKDATTSSTSYPPVIIIILEFENKYLRHQLIMAKKEIVEFKTRIFVNENLLKDLEVEKMELERKLSETHKRLNENVVMLMKVYDSCPWD
jgi:hypothetical protein